LDFLTLQDGTDGISRNVGKKLSQYVAYKGADLMVTPCINRQNIQDFRILPTEFTDVLCSSEHLIFPFIEDRFVYMVLVGKPEGKRPLGRPRRRWEDNIKMDLQ
jgi:hypothetical protein